MPLGSVEQQGFRIILKIIHIERLHGRTFLSANVTGIWYKPLHKTLLENQTIQITSVSPFLKLCLSSYIGND